MNKSPITGVVPILLTPFDLDGRIDEAGIERLVEFTIAAGVHGLGVALGSEIFKLNEAERDQLISRVIKSVAGRVPVVINSGAAGTDLAVFYSLRAEQLGADALMIVPPTFMAASPEEICEYYGAISASVGIPIMLQDVAQGPISAPLAMRIASDCPNVKYIKVETVPVPTKVAAMHASAGEMLTVLGGAGGTYFIEEMRRGSKGTMPFAPQSAAFREVWDRFQSGDEAGARTTFDTTIAPVNRVAAQDMGLSYHVHKQLLVRLGVFTTAFVRSPAIRVDATTQREIDHVLSEVAASSGQ
jgi:dihydrodipicolinate synthase/N-acetylneuraminate lyase